MSRADFPQWLAWAREIQSLCQTGLTYAANHYEKDRYTRFMEIAAEIIQSHTEMAKEDLVKNFLAQPGYATPKVDVRGAIIRDGKILLVQERSDERWAMPGGWADVGEFPSEMVVREVWEESGFKVVPEKVVGLYDANRSGRPLEFYHAYKAVFLCAIVGGEARISEETQDVRFFPFENLPPLSTNRTNERHLKDVLAHFKDPSLPVAFD